MAIQHAHRKGIAFPGGRGAPCHGPVSL